MVKASWTYIVAVALASTVLLSSGLATHMSSYVYYPTEHDDMGRVSEPDFQSTSVLGPTVSNCVADLTPGDPGCIPDGGLGQAPGNSPFIAPGCTDDAGRQPSGLCGLWTIGAGDGNTGALVPQNVVGTRGQSGSDAPGRLTPDKATVIRLLDAQTQFQMVPPAGGSKYVDVNRKLDDSGLRGALGGLDPSFGSQVITPGGTGLWAWYGTWQDKNGNGVIDHLEGDPPGLVSQQNEFVWIGKCIQFDGTPAPPGQTFCRNETGPNGALVKMPVWVYPGNHHAYCGFAVTPQGLECGFAPADFPGRQLWNTFLAGFATPEEADDTDSQFTGDVIFGQQNLVSIDVEMGDRTGDATITGRHWVYGNGFASFYYDQSLLVSTVIVTGVTFGSPDSGRATTYDLSQLTSRDVDTYRTFSPAGEEQLQRTVKPAARSNWVFVRDAYINGVNDVGDLGPRTRITYDECDDNLGVCLGTNSAATLGRAFDSVFDPGWAREPNHASDSFPAATRGVCTASDPVTGSAAFRTHQGLCNNYAGHSGQWHAYMDVRSFPAWYTSLAWGNPLSGQCITCVTAGPSGTIDPGAGYLRGQDDFSRVLAPGSHVFFGYVGAWRDRSQAHSDLVLDVLGTVNNLALTQKWFNVTVGPDGYLGSIVNTTGANRANGFGPQSCTVYGTFRQYEWAQCHPYMDGNLDYVQSLDEDLETGGEFDGGETGSGAADGQWRVVLRSAAPGGCWTQPTFVWRSFDTWTIGDVEAIDDFTGLCVPIEMTMGQGGDGGPGIEGNNLVTKDLFVLPLGNVGMAVQSQVSGVLRAVDPGKGLNLVEAITDVDRYGPFGG